MAFGDGSLLRALAGAAKQKHPIAAAVVETLGPAMIEAIQSGDPEKMEAAAKREPQVVNNLNLESPLQSGVTVTSLGGLVGGALFLGGYYLLAGTLPAEMVGGYVISALGFAGVLLRRWMPNLKPLGK